MVTTLFFVGQAFLLINIILYVIYYSSKGNAYRFFVGYLLAIFSIQLVMYAYSSNDLNNHFLSTYYLFLQFVLLSGFFYWLFKPVQKKISSVVKYVSILVFAGLVAQYIFDPALYYVFNTLGFLASSAVLIIYTVFYLYEMLSKKLPFYYVCVGLFIYLMSSSLIFVMATSLISFGDKISVLIWNINAFLFIVYQLLILWEWKQSFFRKKTA
ncbi:MAG TPA: hypothetical protein VFM65_09930 [Flavobacteriaceae bacterium]|nr:hypothetical protein [Flavobacteriaceae bacterium]